MTRVPSISPATEARLQEAPPITKRNPREVVEEVLLHLYLYLEGDGNADRLAVAAKALNNLLEEDTTAKARGLK